MSRTISQATHQDRQGAMIPATSSMERSVMPHDLHHATLIEEFIENCNPHTRVDIFATLTSAPNFMMEEPILHLATLPRSQGLSTIKPQSHSASIHELKSPPSKRLRRPTEKAPAAHHSQSRDVASPGVKKRGTQYQRPLGRLSRQERLRRPSQRRRDAEGSGYVVPVPSQRFQASSEYRHTTSDLESPQATFPGSVGEDDLQSEVRHNHAKPPQSLLAFLKNADGLDLSRHLHLFSANKLDLNILKTISLLEDAALRKMLRCLSIQHAEQQGFEGISEWELDKLKDAVRRLS
ncbi:hypothetical protein MSAN_00774500 [Mycena sanguinolenta]|uniref:Uncharacterized protein n=1 Tax=Mycena sanguinolenta TaxID=230812 RepID=A0A8H7DEF8_9AGAR|nr:hypothetical protein MSAN_00774500 [Mycena sanguinolenta]